jgi:tRNA A37 threonylcarbamoyladenosine dehydratase
MKKMAHDIAGKCTVLVICKAITIRQAASHEHDQVQFFLDACLHVTQVAVVVLLAYCIR